MVGLFCAFLPVPGQMVIAAVMAVWIGSNLPVSVGLVWLTNPITIPPVFYATYKLGSWILGTDPVKIEWTRNAIEHDLSLIWWPLLFGSLLSGLFFAGVGYLVINQIWIWSVQKSWRSRKRKQQIKAPDSDN